MNAMQIKTFIETRAKVVDGTIFPEFFVGVFDGETIEIVSGPFDDHNQALEIIDSLLGGEAA